MLIKLLPVSLFLFTFVSSVKSVSNERLQTIPLAELLVIKQNNSNVYVGQKLQVGQVVKTNNFGVVNGHILNGGNVELSSWAWGVKNIELKENSTLSIKSYALCAGGGRILELNVTGTAYIHTRYLTQSCSAVKVCFGIGKGCVTLRSSAQIKDLENDRYVVGVTEGHGVVQDVNQITPPITVLAGQYSIMNADGIFTFAQTVNTKVKPYKITAQSKSVQHLVADEGWGVYSNGKFSKTATVVKGAPIRLKSPLD